MPEATLKLTIPEGVWIGDFSQQHPDAVFSVLSAIPNGGTGVALVEITAPNLEQLLSEMESHEEITAFQVLNKGAGKALVEFETSNPLLLMLMHDSGVPLELPFDLSDRTALWEVTATHDRISELSSQLESFGIPFTVEALRYELSDDQPLTESQRLLLQTAVEMGYYKTPRECSLTDIAEEVGRAKSTVSEILHRAEGTIITQYVEREQSQWHPTETDSA